MVLADFDYIANRNEIIRDAFGIAGVLEAHQNLSAAQQAQGEKLLQLMVKHWSNKHLFMWSFLAMSFNTVIAQEAYTTADLTAEDQTIIGLDKAWEVDGTDDIPLEVVSYSRYLDFYDKESNTGRPRVVAFRRAPSPTFYIWPSPDAVYAIKGLAVFPLKDFDSASGVGNVPVNFQLAMLYGLADLILDKYPGPMNEREFIKARAGELFMEAKIADSPIETTSEIESLFPARRC